MKNLMLAVVVIVATGFALVSCAPPDALAAGDEVGQVVPGPEASTRVDASGGAWSAEDFVVASAGVVGYGFPVVAALALALMSLGFLIGKPYKRGASTVHAGNDTQTTTVKFPEWRKLIGVDWRATSDNFNFTKLQLDDQDQFDGEAVNAQMQTVAGGKCFRLDFRPEGGVLIGPGKDIVIKTLDLSGAGNTIQWVFHTVPVDAPVML